MRVLLANAPWTKKDKYGVRAGSRWPFTLKPGVNGKRSYLPFPFFLAYAAALLKKTKKEVILIDAVAEGVDYETFQKKVSIYNPDIVVLETSTPSFENDIGIIKEVILNLSKCKIILSGPHASVFAAETLKDYAFVDYIAMGEYEYTLLDLVNCLENGGNLGEVLGLAYREEDEIRINAFRPTIKNLDDLPRPTRKELPMYNYNDGFCGLPVPNIQVLASRGCPYQCNFCIWPQVIYRDNLYRKRKPEAVVDEVQCLLEQYAFKAVYFDDDVFNIDKSFVMDLCREFKKRNINIPWAAMARVDLMDEGLLKNMHQAGFYAVKYGIESADQNILKYCNKNMDLNKARKIIKLTKNLGIKVHLTFCLGLPGETKNSINKTIEFIDRVSPDSLQVSFATPFPGTDYFKYVKDKGYLLSENWPDYDGNSKCIIRTDELSADYLEKIRKDLCKRYNL